MANLLSWLGNKAKEVAAGVERQVNPFDGGATYSNPRPPQQQQKIQAQRQQAQNLINRATQIQQQVNNAARNPLGFAGGQAYNIAKSITPIQVRDVFDANTASDQAKRLKANEPRMYADQQKAMGNKRPYQNVGSALLGSAATFANTAGATVGEGIDTGRILAAGAYADATGDQKPLYDAFEANRLNKEKRYAIDSGILGRGTWFDSAADFDKTVQNPVELAKRAGSNVVGAGLELGSFGLGGARNKLAEVGLKQFAKTGAVKAGVRAFEGTLSDIAEQQLQRDKYSPQQTIAAAGASAALPIAGTVIAGAAKPVFKGIAKGLNALAPDIKVPKQLVPGIDQPRNAGKYAEKPVVPGADIKKTGGTQRLLNQAEMDHYARTGNIPANADGKVNVIKPGQIDDVRGITPDRTYLVTLRDGLPIDSQAGPQAAIKGPINRKFVASVEPYVPTGESLARAEAQSRGGLFSPEAKAARDKTKQGGFVSLGKKADDVPETTRVFVKSKFRDGGGYADIPVIRKVENKTLYQGGSADGRPFWTENKKYAEQFGDVTEKTGTFYEVDNGNRMTSVYVDAANKPKPKRSWIPDEGGFVRLPKRKGASEGDYWTTPLKDSGPTPVPAKLDSNGVQIKPGDKIEFYGASPDGKKGTTTIRWEGPYKANASGKEFPGQWLGNGTLDNSIPFKIIERDGKPFNATKQMIAETPKPKPTTKLVPEQVDTPVAKSKYGTLEEFKNNYSLDSSVASGISKRKTSNGNEFWGASRDFKKPNDVFTIEDMYKRLTSQEAKPTPNRFEPKIDVTAPKPLPIVGEPQVRTGGRLSRADYEQKYIDLQESGLEGKALRTELDKLERQYTGTPKKTSQVAAPKTVSLAPKEPTPRLGTYVRSVERDNVGKLVSRNSDGSYNVRFTNKKEGTTATIKLTTDQFVDPKAPKAPITAQATPDEIKISTAATNNKQGVKAGAQEVREQFVNRFAPVEDLVSKIERETGTPLRPSKNPLSYVRQYLGGGGIANDKIDNALTPIIKQTKEFDGLRQYLVAKRMNELADRGMSKRADNVLAELSAKYGDEIGNFDKIAKELYEYQGKQLDELVDVGVLSRQAADEIRAKNQFYVPFNRVIPELENFAGGGGQAIGRNGNPIKAIKGSDKEIIDPIESMIRNTYDIQATVQKQKVMRSLYELAPDEFTVPPKGSMNKNRVGMFINGEKVAFETSEPLSRALNNMAEEQLNLAVRVMSLPAKMLRSGATSLNVAFALPNIVRDQLSAAVNSKYGGIPVYDFVSGLASVMKKDDVYKNWIRSGADQASFFAQDRTTLQRGVKDITGGAGYKAGKLVKSPLELFRILGEVSEKGSRVGVYKRAERGALKEFGNVDDALLAAAKESREATIDFARRGSKMKAANSLIPFLNARLQGTLKLANSFKERPVQTASIGMAIAGLPAAALYLHNSEDPAYAEIPDYIKRENFIIMTGNKDTPFIKIPKGEVGKIFGNPVESFLAQLKSEDPSWKSTAQSFVDSFLPVGSVSDPAKFVTDLMPTAASVPMQMLDNFDTFRGMPIVSQWQKDLPPEQQFSNYNTETGKKIGAALGVSPAMLEFGIGGLTGGLGRQALQMADVAQGYKIPVQDLPVVSRFAGEQKDLNKSANAVYDQLEKDKQATARENYKIKQALKDGDTSALSGLDSAKAKQLQRSVTEDQIKKDLTPTEKALWGMSKEDLENYSGKYGSAASKVLDLKNSISSTSSNPKDKYQSALREYEADKKAGKISDVKDMKQQSTLARLKAQSESSQDAVDLYSLSFKNMVSFVNSNKNGSKLWEEVKALDKRMTDAGYTSKLYNKNGSLKATVAKGKGGKRGGAKKGRVTKLPNFNITGKAVSYKKVGAPKAKLPVSKLPKIKINKLIA